MKAKEYLNQIKILDSRVANKIAERDHIRDMLCRISGMSYDERVQTSPSDQLGNGMVRLSELNVEVDKLMDEYLDTSAMIISQINHLDNADYSNILHKRYVQYLSLRAIARTMHYSYDWIRHLHGQALDEVEKRYLQVDTKKHI